MSRSVDPLDVWAAKAAALLAQKVKAPRRWVVGQLAVRSLRGGER